MLEENDLISILNILLKAPSLVKEVTEKGFNTEFGLIELDCQGSCVKITLSNKAVISVDIATSKSVINDLFNQINDTCIAFGVFVLKHNLKKCYDMLSNPDDTSGNI